MTTARMLTREPEGRETQHVRLLIPRKIKGLSEDDRVTLQTWLKLVDWTDRNVSPYTQTPRKMKLNIDSRDV
jgi:hypothetical protein